MKYLILAFLLLTGCNQTLIKDDYHHAIVNIELSERDCDFLADQVTKTLSSQYLPAKTTLRITKKYLSVLSEQSCFQKYLVNKMTHAGFGISNDNDDKTVLELGYIIDNLHLDVAIRVTVGDKFQLNRSYKRNQDGLVVDSPMHMRR